MTGAALRLLVTGAAKDWASAAVADYEKRLARMVTLETTVLKEPPWAEEDPAKYFLWIEREYLARSGPDACTVALDPASPPLGSEGFAAELARRRRQHGALCFWVGGSLGLGRALVGRAHWKLSFGPMTFAHGLFRVMLLEQLYRAHSILQGGKYHK